MRSTTSFGALVMLVLASGAFVASCSGSSVDSLCARVSACLGNTMFSFGLSCEDLSRYQHADRTAAGTQERVGYAKLDCVRGATDCATMRACGTASPQQAAVCNGAGFTSRCSGDAVVYCTPPSGGAPLHADDCGAAGLVCAQTSNGAQCGTEACDPALTAPSCQGDQLTWCDGASGARLRTSCVRLERLVCLTCGVVVTDACRVVNGVATCVAGGEPCDEKSFAVRCEGTSVVGCTRGHVGRYDCATVDPALTCAMDTRGVRCTGGEECDEGTPESCVNGVISYCMWGKKATLDCRAQGLSGCSETSPFPGHTAARCIE